MKRRLFFDVPEILIVVGLVFSLISCAISISDSAKEETQRKERIAELERVNEEQKHEIERLKLEVEKQKFEIMFLKKVNGMEEEESK